MGGRAPSLLFLGGCVWGCFRGFDGECCSARESKPKVKFSGFFVKSDTCAMDESCVRALYPNDVSARNSEFTTNRASESLFRFCQLNLVVSEING